MTKLRFYIAKHVFFSILAVLVLVLCLDFIGQVMDQLNSLRANYTFYEMLVYILWRLPTSVYQYLPYAVLVGCLIGLGALASSSELVIVRAAGVSVARIVWIVLQPVLLFIVCAIALGEYVIPYADQVAESRRSLALGYTVEDQSKRGVWHREGNQYFYFNVVQPDGQLFGFRRYTFNDKGELTQASFTRKASFNGEYWLEEGVSVTEFTATGTTAEKLPERRWETELTPALLNIVAVAPETLSIASLHQYVEYLTEQNLYASEYKLAFWQKVFQPVATASLVLIAISFVFGPLREVSMGQRIFTGVVFGIGFRLLQSLLGPSSIVFGFAPLIAVIVPIAVCAGLGVYLLKRSG
ncbi:LPS export ABC transporter permease LptG [Gilvimarinus sp. SDUM040013]|uniref:LPS export ABC transporter permease LptG n=1 Tax=Gilvimarinus gilvus TaxID=3058038 RepID=A0ABU4RYR0_9GAMM|nr:LPS export ABC transporter permease LptG [Gilvimarinus sp. SDUM040013]MDO3386297.1 LPS export ABC transporter permease LptG [Gilvimarinus sp. SDUM040013]MDX6850045.1 LPS export ABC transporter permease LptG [Gilvimarinus sp. SDUM040013]